MKTVIFSDVHGNLPAFEAMLKHAGKCDNYICLGDLVNYGPWSNECVDLALSLPNHINLMGNHEEAFIDGFYSGQNPLVQDFFQQCIEDFKRFEEIKRFRSSYIDNNYTFIHTIQNQYIYPDTNVQLDANYIIGHSHHQFFYRNNDYQLYNAGSVGQNRKYINVINYLIYDSIENKVELRNLCYDIDVFIDQMKVMDYPENCIAYYINKEKYNG